MLKSAKTDICVNNERLTQSDSGPRRMQTDPNASVDVLWPSFDSTAILQIEAASSMEYNCGARRMSVKRSQNLFDEGRLHSNAYPALLALTRKHSHSKQHCQVLGQP